MILFALARVRLCNRLSGKSDVPGYDELCLTITPASICRERIVAGHVCMNNIDAFILNYAREAACALGIKCIPKRKGLDVVWWQLKMSNQRDCGRSAAKSS